MTRKLWKKTGVVLLCIAMLMSFMPQMAFGATSAITNVSYIDEKGKTTDTDTTPGEGTAINVIDKASDILDTSDNTYKLTTGWYLVNGNVTFDTRIIVSGDVHLILANNYVLTASAGISVTEKNSFTVYAQSTNVNEMGTLTASANGYYDAGIGGEGSITTAGTITINGGKVTASAQPLGFAAGIGGGSYSYGGDGGRGGTITINGGVVTATGSYDAAGIGGGAGYNSGGTTGGAGGIITINGGTVVATGGKFGAPGIGGGMGHTKGGDGGIVSITRGTVITNGIGGAGTNASGISGDKGSFSLSNDGIVITTAKIQDENNSSSWNGLVIANDADQSGIYGDDSFTLNEDVEIPAGTHLKIDSGKTLTINDGVTLAVNGTLIINGTISGSGTIDLSGGGTISGTIPQNIKQQYGVTNTLTGLTSTGAEKANNEEDYTATLSANSNYMLPGSITVTIGGTNFEGHGYTKDNPTITIPKDSINGNIIITAAGVSQLATPNNLQWNGTTATWSAVNNASGYTVQLYKDGSPVDNSVQTATNTTYNFDFSNPAEGSYTFTVTANGTGDYSDSPASSQSTALNFYTVSFNTGDGSTVSPQVIVSGGKVQRPEEDPVKTSYTFSGWYKEQAYTTEWDFADEEISETTTIYAKWEARTYKVTLNTNGGTIIEDKDVKSYTYGTGATLPDEEAITREGYKFDGWYSSDKYIETSPFTKISSTDTGEKIFYAKWISTDASVKSVSIGKTVGTPNQENVIDMKLPYGSELPASATDIEIETTNEKAEVTSGPTLSEDGKTWTFTVTAEDEETTQDYTINVSIGSRPSGGGTITPPKPDISQGDGYETEVDKDGNLEIKVDDDYEIQDVLVNGESRGPVTSLSGLKTGDTVEIIVISKEDKHNAYLKDGVKNTTIKAWSERTKKGIKVYFKKSYGFKVDGYEFFRSTKKGTFSKKPYYVSKKGTARYLNNTKNIKKGTHYYYKIRGYRTIGGEKVYTKWSNVANRTAK